mgnify:FL=1
MAESRLRRLQFERLEERHLLAAGLTAQYFDTASLSSLMLTRVDTEVNFDWGDGSPDVAIQPDTFSVRWTGRVEPLYSEHYTFSVNADEGFRLWIDGQLIVSNWTSGAPMELSGQIALAAGQWYDLKLEYFENTGTAGVQLYWASPSQAKEIIPSSRLDSVSLPDDRGSIHQEIWLGIGGSSIESLTGNAAYPNQPNARGYLISFESVASNWADSYGQRVRGYLVPDLSGTYRFAISGDDRTALYLSTDDNPAHKTLIAWSDAPTDFREFTRFATQVSAPITLVAGQKYYIEALHKEDSGGDHFSVAWQTPSSSQWTVIPGDVLAPYGTDTTLPPQGSILTTLAAGHSRLLATPERWAWLAEQVTVPGQIKTWYDSVKSSADSILTQPVSEYVLDNRSTLLTVSRTVVDRIYKLAMVYRISGNAAYAERAWAELNAAAAFPNWNPSHFLDTAEMTHAFAIGYDWLYSYWTPERRAVIATAIVEKGLNQALPLYRKNSSWVSASSNNWNTVCNGGMILGALAVAEEYPVLVEEILAKAVPSAAAILRHFSADAGGWYEGPGYWNYTTSYLVRMLAGLESALGSDFGLGRTPGVAEAGRFALLDTSPTKLSFNFADGGAGNIRGPQLFWFARRFNDPLSAWHERTNGSASPLDLLWYDARGTTPGTVDFRSDVHYRGDTSAYATQDVVTMRTDWNSATATFLGFKAGKVGDSHGHLDAGSFVLDALGKRWIYDLGGDDYALPGYFGSSRWTYYRLRAEGHNTLVINPSSAADQKVGALPTIVRQQSTANAALSIADLTSAYTGATRVWRGIKLNRFDGSVLLQDEIEAPTAADVWWFAHVKLDASQIEISADGASAMLTQGGERLWVKILTPGATLAVMPAAPLPASPNPDGQNANAGFLKLAIHLPAVTKRQLAIWFVPLEAGRNAPLTMPQVESLASWRLDDDRRVWLGDIDGLVSGHLSDAVYVDALWQSQVAAALGQPLAGFDSLVPGQIVPFSFQFAGPAGQQVVDARLTLSLRATGDASGDRVYIESTSGSYSWADLGWTAPTTAASAQTLNLSRNLAWLQDGLLNVAVGPHVAVDWAVLDVTFAPKGFYSTTTVEASADAYVRDGTYANENFATGGLTVKKDSGTGYNREAFLKFDLSGITEPVAAAMLCLTPDSFGAIAENQLYFVADDSWTESGITWNNRPVGGSYVASWQPVAGKSLWIDVGELVRQQAAGDGLLSLKIVSSIAGSQLWMQYASRESTSVELRPRLIVTTLETPLDGIWRIDGDRRQPNENDYFRLAFEDGYAVVSTDAASIVPPQRRDIASLEQIIVRGLGGNDTIIVDSARNLLMPGATLVLDGGAGADTLDLAGGIEARRTPSGLLLDGAPLSDSSFEFYRFGVARLVVSGATQSLATDQAISQRTDLFVESGGTLNLGGFATSAKSVVLVNGTITNGTLIGTSYTVQNGTISASLGGSGSLTKNTTGKVILSGENFYTGATTVYQGILNVRHGQALGIGNAAVTVSCDGATNRYSTLEFEGPDFTVAGKPLNTTGNGVGGIGALRNIGGTHTWIGNITLTGGGGGSTYHAEAGELIIIGDVTTNMTSRTLTLRGEGNGQIIGAIQNGLTTNLPVIKQGNGRWIFGGANTYTGTTTISAGTLIITGSLAGGAVSVASGATLAGSGTIGGTVTVSNNGRLAPGGAGAVGTITVGGLTLSSTAQVDADLRRPDDSDRIIVAGTLMLNGGKVNLAALEPLQQATYPLISYGTLAGSFSNLALGTQPVAAKYQLVNNTSANAIELAVDTPPVILEWFSANTHGRGVGEAALPIADDGTFTEPRDGGIRRLVVAFNEPVNPASLTPAGVRIAGNDAAGGPIDLSGIGITVDWRDSNTMAVIDFATPLPDFARYLVRLEGIRDSASNPLSGDNDRIFTALRGDVSGDCRVKVTDLSRINGQTIDPISANELHKVRADVSMDGRVNVTDLSRAWAFNGRDARSIADPVLVAGLWAEEPFALVPSDEGVTPIGDGTVDRHMLLGFFAAVGEGVEPLNPLAVGDSLESIVGAKRRRIVEL